MDNIKVFDPLDRPIMGEDDNGDTVQLNITSADLYKAINEMPAMDSKSMNIPLDNEKYQTLLEMLNDEKKLCMDKAEEQLIEARNQGTDFHD